MADVVHPGRFILASEVITDGPGVRLLAVCWTENCPDVGNGIFSFQSQGDYWRFLHEGADLREELEVADVSIVLFQKFIAGLEHLDAPDAESFLEVAVENSSGAAFLYAIGFEENQGRFGCHRWIRLSLEKEIKSKPLENWEADEEIESQRGWA